MHQDAQGPHLDLGIVRPAQNEAFIADLQFQPDAHPQIGIAGQQHVAGLGVDEVRILVAGAQRRHLYLVAPLS